MTRAEAMNLVSLLEEPPPNFLLLRQPSRLLLLRRSGSSFFSAAASVRPCFCACVEKPSLLATAASASLQITSAAASALLLKPAAGTPVPGKGVVTCKFPADPTVALGYLSFAFLIVSTVAGYMSLFYPYKGKSVPQGVLFKH
ncbi:hypothetical protein PIB30_086139 [Stylosanthes scabra]|uniref:Transmembrane protein n=1 Tax=Stylosanthes scabra TaxID=79078 RepID=A0ABU6QTK9_9FABA|nr:hypothetical protein [Stylosanthes scabra]